MVERLRAADEPSPEAIEFIRFCYRRRRMGWPELYDEMCAVAARGLYRGWGFPELAERGVGFSLFGTSRLAALVDAVVRQERALTTPSRSIGRRESVSELPARPEPLPAG